MTTTDSPQFIAEISSNHHQDIDRCIKFIEVAAQAGCDAVKFQLFKIEELFAPEVLQRSEEHRRRKQWELPLEFIPRLYENCKVHNIAFSCTPFYLQAVAELIPYVDFLKIASYELLWTDLLRACAQSKLPVVMSCGMATLNEIDTAVSTLKESGATDITLLHCVSAYPTPVDQCNLAAIGELKNRYGVKVGWSDHSVQPAVIYRAVHRWRADAVEFHIDLDRQGAEYKSGHCWLPDDISQVIKACKLGPTIDGMPTKQVTASEQSDRDWRADPSDGLRPLKHIRQNACL